MSSATPDLNAIAERLEKLERQNRRMKQAGTVALVVAVAALLMGQAAPQRTVEANAFFLKDADGTLRGSFEAILGRPTLTLNDSTGHTRVELFATEAGSGLTLYDEKQNRRVVIAQDNDLDGAMLVFYDESGNLPLRLEGHAGHGSLFMWPTADSPRVLLQSDPDGPMLLVADKEGFPTSIGATDTGRLRTAASVVLSDKDKKVLWKAP